MKQTELAKLVGITKVHMNNILCGRGRPSIDLSVRLQELTGIAKEIWAFGTPEERRAAWDKAKEEAKG